jgi:hypothetical protein
VSFCGTKKEEKIMLSGPIFFNGSVISTGTGMGIKILTGNFTLISKRANSL